MKTGRPRKVGMWTAKLMRLYHQLGYDTDALSSKFKISKRTVYRYIAKGGYNVNDKKGLRKNCRNCK